MSEVRYAYGNYGSYRNSLFGKVNLSQKAGTKLDVVWGELSEPILILPKSRPLLIKRPKIRSLAYRIKIGSRQQLVTVGFIPYAHTVEHYVQ